MAEENKSGLTDKINLLSTQLNVHKQSVNFKNPSTFLSKAENTLSKHLKNHQLNLIRTNKKLKFYSIFKNETNHSEFINHIRNPEHRRVASKKLEDLQSPKLLKTLESVIIATKIRLKMNCTWYFTVINTMIWERLFLKSTTEIHYLQITISMIKSVFFLTILIHISAG